MRPKAWTPDRALRIGVDFGTTHTIVALADSGNYPVLNLPYEYTGEVLTADFTPSCLTVLGDRLYFGPAATRCFLERFEDGATLIPSIKRLLQHWYVGQRLEAGGREYQVSDLLTAFLSEVRRAVLRAVDVQEAEIEAVIAVPANASSSQRYVTLNCFREAGFRVLQVLDEPAAAGIQFVRERYKRWDRVEADVIIYDLGGGTFDATLLSIEREKYDPVLSRGISRLGGDDFDAALLSLVEEARGGIFRDRERIEMLQVVRAVKESIGPYTQKLHVDTSEGVVSIPVRDFHEAVRPLMDRTIELMDQVIAKTMGRRAEADRIVLVGGGTLLGVVPKLLRERYGRAKVHQGLYPFAAVAIGAAIQAESPNLEVQSRLNNHFGVIRVLEDGQEYVDVIFEKGLPLPEHNGLLRVTRPPYDPRYNIGRFQYLECDHINPKTQMPGGEPVYWNEILFPYDRAVNPDGAAPRDLEQAPIARTPLLREERILEEYFLDEYGIITTRISRTIQDGFSNCYNLYRRR
ncbi:MAG: Hsp70 family protein [Thermodesulfobacteriota bacterium]